MSSKQETERKVFKWPFGNVDGQEKLTNVFDISKAASLVFLQGEHGVGKTTLVNMMCSLQKFQVVTLDAISKNPASELKDSASCGSFSNSISSRQILKKIVVLDCVDGYNPRQLSELIEFAREFDSKTSRSVIFISSKIPSEKRKCALQTLRCLCTVVTLSKPSPERLVKWITKGGAKNEEVVTGVRRCALLSNGDLWQFLFSLRMSMLDEAICHKDYKDYKDCKDYTEGDEGDEGTQFKRQKVTHAITKKILFQKDEVPPSLSLREKWERCRAEASLDDFVFKTDSFLSFPPMTERNAEHLKQYADFFL